MEATSEMQRIEQLILSARRPDGEYHENRKMSGSLATLISDPRIFRHENLLKLPRGLREESFIIFDALESVTNGMYNPEILHRLRSIEEESAFSPWKYTILGILAFYQADRDNMLQLLGKVPEDTPPALIKEVLLYLTGIKKTESPGPREQELIDLVREDHTFIRSALEQIEEYLEADFGDAFVETSVLLMRELLPSYPGAARKLALWSMHTAADRDYDLSALLPHFTGLFGKNESMRLTALALAETEPHISVLFWLRYAVSRPPAEFAADREVTSAVLSILADTYGCFRSDEGFARLQLDDGYTRSLLSLIRKLQDDLHRHAEHGPIRENQEEYPPEILEERTSPFRWLEHVWSLYGEGNPGPGLRVDSVARSTPKQLELFEE